MDWWLILAVFLYLACAVLLVAEVFVPSAGLLFVFSLGCLAGGITIFFRHSPAAGWAGVVIALVMIPTVLVGAYKVFPKSRFGKRVLLEPPGPKGGEAIPDAGDIRDLLGATGTVITPMRPVGMCDFSGRRVECVAESGYVEKGRPVRVIRVESTQVTVRVVEGT